MKWQTGNLMISRVLSIFVLQFAILVQSLPAQDIQWVTVEGIALMEDTSKEEARNRALEDAMHKAVEQVSGDQYLAGDASCELEAFIQHSRSHTLWQGR